MQETGTELSGVALADDPVAEVTLPRQRECKAAEADGQRGEQRERERALVCEWPQLFEPAERREPSQPAEPARSVGDHAQEEGRSQRETGCAGRASSRPEQL